MKLTQNPSEEIHDECIYLILEREFVSNPIKVAKIGKSKCFRNRMGETRSRAHERIYPKGSKILYTSRCDNSSKSEIDLLVLFNIMFKQRKDIGLEYFEGNPNQMINQIRCYFYNQNN